jgi:hypothetical protein
VGVRLEQIRTFFNRHQSETSRFTLQFVLPKPVNLVKENKTKQRIFTSIVLLNLFVLLV